MTPPEVNAWNFWICDYSPKGVCDGFLFWKQTAIFLRIDLFIDVALQVIVKNVLKIMCFTKVLCKETMFIFKCRWQCQCRYFQMGKLTQSYWDEKLWNYVAFIVSDPTFFLNAGREGEGAKMFFNKLKAAVDKCRNCLEGWWIRVENFFGGVGGIGEKELQFFLDPPVFLRNMNFLINKK